MKLNLFKIGVIIPFYNRAESIERAITSIYNQKNNHLEETEYEIKAIIINDGSNIEEASILNSLKLKYPTLSIYSLHKNKGATFARNLGKEQLPNMDWYTFLDSDEEWKSDFINEFSPYLKKDFGWICSGFETKNRFGKTEIYIPPENSTNSVPSFLFKEEGHLKTSCMLFSAQTLTKVEWDNELKRFQDLDYALRLYLAGYTPRFISKSLVVSYTNQENRISNYPAADLAINWIDSYKDKIDKKYIQAFKDKRMPALLAQEWRVYESFHYILSSKTISNKEKITYLRRVSKLSAIMAIKAIKKTIRL